MFFKLILENANGDRVDMTATANRYMTSRVEGLNPPTGTISTRVFCKKFVNDIGFRNICSQAFNDKRRSFIVFHDTLKSGAAGAYDIMLTLCGVGEK